MTGFVDFGLTDPTRLRLVGIAAALLVGYAVVAFAGAVLGRGGLARTARLIALLGFAIGTGAILAPRPSWFDYLGPEGREHRVYIGDTSGMGREALVQLRAEALEDGTITDEESDRLLACAIEARAGRVAALSWPMPDPEDRSGSTAHPLLSLFGLDDAEPVARNVWAGEGAACTIERAPTPAEDRDQARLDSSAVVADVVRRARLDGAEYDFETMKAVFIDDGADTITVHFTYLDPDTIGGSPIATIDAADGQILGIRYTR